MVKYVNEVTLKEYCVSQKVFKNLARSLFFDDDTPVIVMQGRRSYEIVGICPLLEMRYIPHIPLTKKYKIDNNKKTYLIFKFTN